MGTLLSGPQTLIFPGFAPVRRGQPATPPLCRGCRGCLPMRAAGCPPLPRVPAGAPDNQTFLLIRLYSPSTLTCREGTLTALSRWRTLLPRVGSRGLRWYNGSDDKEKNSYLGQRGLLR